MNLKKVARLAGVSLATASRVLSGSDYPVTNELRDRVLAAASELDYVPNAQARGLLLGNPSTVGVIVGDVGDPYFSAVVQGLQKRATELDYLVTVINTNRVPERELAGIQALRAHRFGTIVVAGSGLMDEDYRHAVSTRLAAYRAEGNAAVTIGRHLLDVEMPSVAVDNTEAGRLMGAHLAELGHERVGVLAGDMGVTSTIDRIAGLREALGDGLVVLPVEPSREGGYAGAGALLAEHPDLTALAGTADQMAIGALAWLKEHDRRVPDEISVIGCNDIWVSRDLTPSLTTVHFPLEQMGALALEIGIAAREGELRHEMLPVTLSVRESTGRRAG